MSHVPLIEVTRGADVESIHAGSVAVVNAHGTLLCEIGDPDFPTFTRSTLKPLQAVPLLHSNGAAAFGLTTREIALLCASHSGEAMHVGAAQSILAKAGCTERHLQCGCHEPMVYAATETLPPAGQTWTQLHHNCSGKHAGFLAYCVQHRLPLDSYLAPSHPLQQAVRSSVAHVADIDDTDLRIGTDGCSAPNYAMPLSRLALAYARLAQGDASQPHGDALSRLFNAMTTHPEMVSGTGRSDLAFMQTAPGDWVAKVGAEGVQAIGIRSAGLGIAIKIADGNPRGLYTIAISVLHQLGLLDMPETSPLAAWVRPKLRNFAGMETGEIRAVGKLGK